jgi:ADP-heptose:LPS heptosyltransferase
MLSPLKIDGATASFHFQIKAEADAAMRAWLKQHQLAPGEFVLMSPGSPRKKKKWESRRYAALADLILTQTRMNVILLRAPNEYADCKEVFDLCSRKPLMGPSTTFHEAAALVSNCRLLICNDGGINHLSVALGIPSLALFGNTTWQIWSPEGFFPKHYHLVNPQWKRMSDNSFGISPHEAFHKTLKILEDLE